MRLFSLRHVGGTLDCGALLLVLVACFHGQAPTSAVETQSSSPRTGSQIARGFPGIAVSSTNSGGFVIHILSGQVDGGEPLYIIDGHTMNVDPFRGIDWFKVEDIVKINVLKTPDQTSVYGPRGLHGVILITTRQASRAKGLGKEAAPESQ